MHYGRYCKSVSTYLPHLPWVNDVQLLLFIRLFSRAFLWHSSNLSCQKQGIKPRTSHLSAWAARMGHQVPLGSCFRTGCYRMRNDISTASQLNNKLLPLLIPFPSLSSLMPQQTLPSFAQDTKLNALDVWLSSKRIIKLNTKTLHRSRTQII